MDCDRLTAAIALLLFTLRINRLCDSCSIQLLINDFLLISHFYHHYIILIDVCNILYDTIQQETATDLFCTVQKLHRYHHYLVSISPQVIRLPWNCNHHLPPLSPK